MPSTVPHPGCLEFSIHDKGFPHNQQAQRHGHTPHPYIISKNTQKKAQATNNYLDLLYVLKGFQSPKEKFTSNWAS